MIHCALVGLPRSPRSIGACAGVLAIALAAGTAQADMFEIGLNFTGTTLTDELTAHGIGDIPPDTMGGVGPNHIAELINGNYAAYNKSTGALIGSRISDNTFFQNALNNGGGGTVVDTFDPRLVYDHDSNRWFATAVDERNAITSSIMLAVSDSTDPTSGWTGFRMDADSADTRWADFPTLGLDADGVYVSANMFNIEGGPPFENTDTTVFSFPKADLLLATPTVANRTEFQIAGIFSRGFAVQPAIDFGASDGRAALLARPNGSGLHNTLKRTDVLNAGGSATLSPSASISVALFEAPPLAHQPGPDDNIYVTDHRIGSNVFEQGDSLWAVHAIRIVNDPNDIGDDRAGIEWFEIDETDNSVLQTGIISDADLDLYYPSIAANADGDLVIAFSGSSDNQHISSYAVAGTTDAGVTTLGDVTLLKAGASTYLRLDSSSRNRWGDYSATVLDPLKSNRFWTFQEFVFATNVWGIQITEITVPQPATLAILLFGGLAMCRRPMRRRGQGVPQSCNGGVDRINRIGGGDLQDQREQESKRAREQEIGVRPLPCFSALPLSCSDRPVNPV